MTFKDLENKTKGELLTIAKKLEITGRSLLNKDKLIKKIEALLEKKKNLFKPKVKIKKTVKEEAKQKVKSKVKDITKIKKTKAITTQKEVIKEEIKTTVNPEKIIKQNENPIKKSEEIKTKKPIEYKEDVHERFYEEIPISEGLPDFYGEDRLVLQVRDPYWAHAYWEVTTKTENNVKDSIGNENLYSADKVMRIHDITDVDFNGSNSRSFFDLFIGNSSNWYVHLGSADRSYLAEIGYLTKDGKFYPIVRSNIIHTPSDGPSSVIDEEWMIIEEKFREMYALSGGGRSRIGSPEFKDIFEKRWLLWNLSSEGLSIFSKQNK